MSLVEQVVQQVLKTTWRPPENTAVICTLELVCDWGGTDEICCISCPLFNNCKKACKYAEDWVIHLKPCPDAKPMDEEGER